MTSTRRNTWQRAAVRDLLTGADDFRTAQQVHTDLQQVGAKVGLATVYRALQSMADAHELDRVRTPDGELAYRACTPGHHHHITCRECGFSVEVEASMLEKWAQSMADEHGFSDVGHELELFGLCKSCSALEEGQ